MSESSSAGYHKIDVAINVFAKPYRTALSILSLLRQSGQHIGALWLQYEPMGVRGDVISPYAIFEYLREKQLVECRVSQPEIWLARQAVTGRDFADPLKRLAIRYQHAFENSSAPLLFLMHNDVFVFKDILGPMRAQLGDAFAIGQLGQCWNCPASHAELTLPTLGRQPCKPDNYGDFVVSHAELLALYAAAQEKGIFARPYQLDQGEFANQPWPLPECRVNEWACLLDLQKTRPLCLPQASAYPPGAYRTAGEHNLDIGVAWFRDLHASGLKARNFDPSPYLRHWVGTGNNTPIRYARAEDNALLLLRKHFGDYVEWLDKNNRGH